MTVTAAYLHPLNTPPRSLVLHLDTDVLASVKAEDILNTSCHVFLFCEK